MQEPDQHPVNDTEKNTAAGAPPGEAAQAEQAPIAEQLEQAEAKVQELQDAYLRARAEADNIRRRAEADISNARKFALESFASELLPVKDNLERALSVEGGTLDSLKSGVELTLKQLANVLEKEYIREIDPQPGDKFDPHLQQAMSMVESDQPANTVVSVLQKGYLLHDRVLRPALVMVSRG